jgi:acyl dehydratase
LTGDFAKKPSKETKSTLERGMPVNTEFPQVNEGMLAAARKTISAEARERPACFSSMTKDVIRRWAYAIGDTNPLWLDEDYASKSRWGTILSPPTFPETAIRGPVFNPERARTDQGPPREQAERLFAAMHQESTGGGFPGLAGLQVGREFTFYAPVRLNDELVGKQSIVAIVDSEARVPGDCIVSEANVELALAAAAAECAAPSTRIVIQTFDIKVYNKKTGALVLRDLHHMARFARGITLEESKYRDIPPACYSDEEITSILERHLTETARANEVRYFEDVQVGDSLPVLVKGPHTPFDFIMYHSAFGGWFDVTDRAKYLLLQRHPGAGLIDPATNVPDFPIMMHLDHFAAFSMGYPRGFDGSMQRISWFGHAVTNWMGDDAFLRSLTVWHRQPFFLYDTMWINGRVTRKNDADSAVDLELWGENQRGQRISTAQASVVMQSRSGGTFPYK